MTEDQRTISALADVIGLIEQHYVFDAGTYPELRGATESERRSFGLRHCALHFAKTAGEVAALSERLDHGKQLDEIALKAIIPKALINVLRAAALVGLDESALFTAIERKYAMGRDESTQPSYSKHVA